MAELVLDTTYLLPIFGIGVELEGFETLFPQLLGKYEVLYNPLSVVEAKWISLRLGRDDPSMRERLLVAFTKGLKALLGDERLKQTELTNPEIEKTADILLLNASVRDYFDRMIYATAVNRGASLLTEDEELKELARAEDVPKPREVLTWSDLRGKLRQL